MWLVGLALVANSLCPGQEKHTMCARETLIADSGSGGSMNRKKAGIFFLGTCVILAILLLTQVLTPIVGAIVFAVALVAFGVPSNGFRKI
jgi:hypothetical protein